MDPPALELRCSPLVRNGPAHPWSVHRGFFFVVPCLAFCGPRDSPSGSPTCSWAVSRADLRQERRLVGRCRGPRSSSAPATLISRIGQAVGCIPFRAFGRRAVPAPVRPYAAGACSAERRAQAPRTLRPSCPVDSASVTRLNTGSLLDRQVRPQGEADPKRRHAVGEGPARAVTPVRASSEQNGPPQTPSPVHRIRNQIRLRRTEIGARHRRPRRAPPRDAWAPVSRS